MILSRKSFCMKVISVIYISKDDNGNWKMHDCEDCPGC